ncbi:MAG: MFS transporter [Planctomycetaceae bacterium]|jgi:acyl-[acyl-carrier-protein]-phospholipid O-acyltransferase/long-chain-fatty-acid--[acyl-carrier-protein] ligase|nr:MFS transporter [Planctomycetaceae bacterium]
MNSEKPQSLWNKGFIALLITQFTVAFNDNAFRWLLVPIGKEYANGDLIRFLGGAFLIVPFLIWTSIAGYVTDRFSRRNAMIWCKLVELLLLAAAIGVICLGPTAAEAASSGGGMPFKMILLLGIMFLLGSQAAFFSPSKYGTIPDLVPETSISAANGVVSMLTMLACVSGQILGGYVFFWTTIYETINGERLPTKTGIPGGEHVWITAVVLLGAAAIGLLAGFFIPKMKAVDPNAKFPLNPFLQTGRDLAALFSHHKLFLISIASAFFWGLAALAQNNIDKFATEFLMVQQQHVTILAAVLTIGIGIGAVICGWISGKRIELGLVPIGAFGMGFFILILGFTPNYPNEVAKGFGTPLSLPYLFAAAMMLMTGLWAGLYDIPLAAYIQEKSPPVQRGRMIAAYNFMTFSAMFLFIGLGLAGAKVFEIFFSHPSLLIWIATGLFTIVVSIALAYWFNGPFIIFSLRILLHVVYRPKFVGLENIPKEGGALLVSNHVSLLDGLILYAACPRNTRFLAFEPMVPKFFEGCVRETGLIKLLPGNPKRIVQALKTAREALKNGELVGIFAEGGITRNGQMKAFEPGFMSILKGVENVPVIPCHIGGLYESMFSYKYGDKKITFFPRRLLNDVIIAFGKPIYNPQYPQQVQRAVQELGVDTYREHNTKLLPIPARTLIKTCRQRGWKLLFADSTGIRLSGYKFLAAVLISRRLLKKYVLGSRDEEPHVGVLAPMSVGGCVLNSALTLDRRVPVDLNFTFGVEGINYCIKQAGIKHVLTSRKVVERYPNLKLDAKIICSEDLIPKVSFLMKMDCLGDATILPRRILEWVLGLRKKGLNDELTTIIYTSGSTGRPKGVMLTNNNLAEVGRGFVGAMGLNKKDIVLGFLPFFHAFGFMGNFWLPIFCGGSGVFHFSPLEPKKIGEMARKYPVTFIASTPTFLRNFLRRCDKKDFEHVHTVMCGAEKLPIDLIDAWEQKYGVRPSEGFGATELSPVPTTNVPESRVFDQFHTYRKDGSIGRAIINVAVKVIDWETGADLPPNEIGMIVVKGSIVMKGYYKQPELTAEVLKNGWYITGDVGKMDEDGFLWITGRQTRISKIAGEMIPHILIEEEIQKIVTKTLGEPEQTEESVEPLIAVTALPHPTRGEQIIVLHRELPFAPQEIIEQMIANGLPHVWIPHLDGFLKVDSIPVLGTGKLDLAAIKQKAAEIHARENNKGL